ncbi:hypothetical protein SAMN05216282_104204 [Cryobacterium psychrotolerans]|uniref:Uncharacterized protein n=1 Tax=Cryobacterium psychrotolerans TaxID=386301 RepID=A0A1G9AQY7_9MICO|nr:MULTISPECIES: type II secretion system protein [Cryobacterium]TFD42719.1 type II secretion system protein [Cryobacterium sp. TMT1-2-1]TFD89574.1 type II secretion system protein [Cryobacterium psychrotolerans]SDK29254.1 hypothetical protein SAMN05216282_104204 [Cryobacterium psychrotolerans]
MNKRLRVNRGPCEAGFGLIEIVVSMFLLGLLSVAFLPLLVTSLQTSVRNSTIATATQLVNQQMEQARAAGDTCSLITAFGSASLAVVPPDARGVSYQPTRNVESCSAVVAYPTTVKVIVSVSVVGSTAPAQTASTRIYLRAP